MKIESFFPGRLRVSSHLFTKQETLDRIKEQINGMGGIEDVSCNLRTGSVTVKYDAHIISMDMLLEAKIELEKMESEL